VNQRYLLIIKQDKSLELSSRRESRFAAIVVMLNLPYHAGWALARRNANKFFSVIFRIKTQIKLRFCA
jgi:hypothetical protein